MNIKKKYPIILIFLSSILLIGCSGNIPENEATAGSEIEAGNNAYYISLEHGNEQLEAENYEKAGAYFEIALAEYPEGVEAATLHKQTECYIEAVDSFQEENYENAMVKAEVVITFENGSDLLVRQAVILINEIEAIEAKNQTEKETLEEFKGIFVEFKGEPYESTFGNIHIITEEMTVDAEENSGATYSDITGQVIDDETLILDIYLPEQAGYGESWYQMELNRLYDENGYKYLTWGSDYSLYPITVDDMIANGFELYDPDKKLINELREYDEMVPRTIDYLGSYTAKQIEYARVWLNVMDNPGVIELSVYFFEEGEPVIPGFEEDNQLYPEDITVLSGYYGYDGTVAYSSNGDGTINIYNIPERLHDPPEKFPEIIEEALNTRQVYVESLDDFEVSKLIERIIIP